MQVLWTNSLLVLFYFCGMILYTEIRNRLILAELFKNRIFKRVIFLSQQSVIHYYVHGNTHILPVSHSLAHSNRHRIDPLYIYFYGRHTVSVRWRVDSWHATWCQRRLSRLNRWLIQRCYPHMPIGKVWIYRLLFCVCVCVCLYGYGFICRG